MADDNTTPAPASDAPPLIDDSKQWADLAAELEKPDQADSIVEAPPKTEPEPEGEKPAEEAAPEPDKPPPTYEQLRDQERNKTEALKWEREARRRAEESLTNVNKLIDDLRQARQQRQPQEPEQKPLPSVDEDPIGHFQAKVAMLEQALQQTYQGSRQTAEQIRASQEEAQFWNTVQAHEAEYRKTTPTVEVDGKQVSDYDLACEHLKSHRLMELKLVYPDNAPKTLRAMQQYGMPTPDHLRAAMLQQDAIGIAQSAFENGQSPAQVYYEAAKARGYKAPQATSANGKAKPNGALAAARTGTKASMTISGGEGRRSNNDLSRSELADLYLDDPDEFDKMWDKMAKAGKL